MDLLGYIFKLGATPIISRKRGRIIVYTVIAVISAIVIQYILPGRKILPEFIKGIGSLNLLAIFLASLLCKYLDSGLGMGYGTALTPLLILSGFEPLKIVPCVLLSDFIAGVSTALMHHRDGNIDFLNDKAARSTVLWLLLLSAVGAVSAVIFAVNIPKLWLEWIIGIIVILVGIVTLATVRQQLQYRKSRMIVLGTVAAFNKGLSGGGYGPLVTAGQVVSGLSPKKAVAVTSCAKSLVSIIGLTAYMVIQKDLYWAMAVPMCLGAILSVPLATLTVSHLSERTMRINVGVFTCILGIFVFVKLLSSIH